MKQFLEEYAKHATLNFGQALQGLRYFLSHPDIDAEAPRGTARHVVLSAGLRTRRVANDLFFAIMPPHSHHTRDELAVMTRTPFRLWFQYGYCAWRFTETGEVRSDFAGVDRRWDPRCKTEAMARP